MNEEYFPIEDHDEYTSDHVFTSHLARRDKYISELESLNDSARDDHLQTIREEDEYLLKYRRTRNLFGIPLNDEMKQFEPFNYIKPVDSIDALWSIADDMRVRKKKSEFPTYMAAYRWAAKHITQNGKRFEANSLQNEWHKAKAKGLVD